MLLLIIFGFLLSGELPPPKSEPIKQIKKLEFQYAFEHPDGIILTGEIRCGEDPLTCKAHVGRGMNFDFSYNPTNNKITVRVRNYDLDECCVFIKSERYSQQFVLNKKLQIMSLRYGQGRGIERTLEIRSFEPAGKLYLLFSQ